MPRKTPTDARKMAVLVFSLAVGSGCGDESRPKEAALAELRDTCTFERGTLPDETIGREFPLGEDIPIEHFIVVVMENRSFDHYFGAMPGVDGIPEDASNPDAEGVPFEPFHTDEYCIEDVSHSWGSSHRQWNEGAMDGFIVTQGPQDERALGYLTDADIPFYWDLYSTFAMSDRHFAALMGPTWINRYYVTSGTSFGKVRNLFVPEERFEETRSDDVAAISLFEQLDGVGLDWRVYYSDFPWVAGGYLEYFADNVERFLGLEQFFSDLANGEIPPFTMVDPSHAKGVENTNEHPPANPQVGQAFIAQIVHAFMESPIWENSALIITYDEHGGFYDHAEPVSACDPGDYPPLDDNGAPEDTPYRFDQTGFRVPLVVVSPYAKAHYVSHMQTDHASILRLMQAKWGLPALTGRDANAWPLLDMFDFDHPPFVTPPELASATIDEARHETCQEEHGGPIIEF